MIQLNFHWTSLAGVLIIVGAIIFAIYDVSRGGWFAGAAGCLGLFLAIIAMMALLLARAWGWV